MSAVTEQDEMETIDDIAASWAVRLSSPDCTPEERHAFETWRQQDIAHDQAYQRMQRGSALVDRHVMNPLLQEMAQEAWDETEPSFYKKRSWQIGAGAAIAASLLAMMVVPIFLSPSPNTESASTTQQVANANEAYETAIGEQSTITLADGSKVTLNTDSRITVDFAGTQRGITLSRGQALFDVAKDADRPFVVVAGSERIVALGTSFDVHLKEDSSVQVTLIEGKVSVHKVADSKTDPKGVDAPRFKQAIIMAPGEQLSISGLRGNLTRKSDIAAATGWKEGRLVFRQKPLPQVVQEMNRYSTQKLALANDPRLRSMTVSGVFNTGRTSSFVDALETMHSLKSERTGEYELTLEWRE